MLPLILILPSTTLIHIINESDIASFFLFIIIILSFYLCFRMHMIYCTIHILAFSHSSNIVQSGRCTTDELIILTSVDVLIYSLSFYPFLFQAFILYCTSIWMGVALVLI